MKKLLIISIISSLALADCGYKIAKLERELEFARAYGNYYRAQGLERALSNVRAHCGGGYYGDFRKGSISANLDRLEDDAERKIDEIEDKLDELSDAKDTMSKAEYKRRKAELKAQKRKIKQEYKAKKRELKYY